MDRPDLISTAGDKLGRTERFQIRFIRHTLEPGPTNDVIRWCQRRVGALWIHVCTRTLMHAHGIERLPPLDPDRSFICVSNHRSFFDLYVVTAFLVRSGMPHRIVFPVRANFFYDRALGFFVNGVMSFFAMYPPIFRERKRIPLNVTSLDELVWLLRRGGIFAGIHPEGMRNLSEDPYSFLPAQSGVGRVIHGSRVAVLPVFINGLGNDLRRQVSSNFDGTGTPINVVFGAPIDFGELLDRPGSPRVYRELTERTMEAIAELGREERALRNDSPRG
jgi:1-acyl-sn-glycerol-3-phosphate acyltransferase